MSWKTVGPRELSHAVACSALAFVLMLGLCLTLFAEHAGATEPTPQLPDLVADPPNAVSLETSTTDGGLSKEGEPRLLLRFNGYVHNKGPGALDFRGKREAPKVSQKTTEEVERAREKEESLPQKTEEELATPPMQVFQRLFTTGVGVEETNIERAHVDEPSAGEMIYVSADGHHHWHLQRVAKYSLWNSAKTAEAAPAQKVGFCLEDSEHVEEKIGPKAAVYADNVAPFRDFCEQYRPNATGVFEGISPGWRDIYTRELAFQWVDASDVLPGEYWLREDVNPLGVIRETGGANTPAYATSPAIIPGFDALAQSASTQSGEATTLTLTSKAWSDSATPKYTIVSQPQHGTLETGSPSNQVIYRPAAGYTGLDTFTYAASDPHSPFPLHPSVATFSVEIVPAGSTKVLLAGDATPTYSVGDQTSAGREEAFEFTAKSTGTVEELQFRTNANANTGVTGVSLGIFADNAGKPGEVLGQATVSGLPATSSWIKATGLSTAVVSGTNYWLVALPLGEGSKWLHYNVAAAVSAGTGNVESIVAGLTALTPEASWETYNQGPVGFQALGTNTGQASVTIEGAPKSMRAGKSVQLSAHVTNDSPSVTWNASAGSITTGGLYTAPSEPPAGGTVVVTATTTKGAQDERSIKILAAGSTNLLLAGDATTTYSVGHQTAAGREEAFRFTAKSTGTVKELRFRTNATANTGVTGVSLGIFADSAGKPGEVLGRATVSGRPARSLWIKATGLSTAVVSGTNYWLVALPLGEGSAWLHFNVAAAVSAGTGDVESIAAGLTALTPEESWETYNQGPAGFQALGAVSGTASPAAVSTSTASAAAAARTNPARPAARSSRPKPRVMIAGAPSSVIAGTSVQLSALVANERSAVSWRATAGSITSGGLYTAPSHAPLGRAVVLSAISRGARDERRITITPVASPRPAPAAPLPSSPPSDLGFAIGGSSPSPVVSAPQALLVSGQLIITTTMGEAGQARLGAYIGTKRLGGCVVQTPASRSFTCRLNLAGVSPDASIGLWASLRVGGKVLRSGRAAAPIPPMMMPFAAGVSWLRNGYQPSSLQFICGQ